MASIYFYEVAFFYTAAKLGETDGSVTITFPRFPGLQLKLPFHENESYQYFYELNICVNALYNEISRRAFLGLPIPFPRPGRRDDATMPTRVIEVQGNELKHLLLLCHLNSMSPANYAYLKNRLEVFFEEQDLGASHWYDFCSITRPYDMAVLADAAKTMGLPFPAV